MDGCLNAGLICCGLWLVAEQLAAAVLLFALCGGRRARGRFGRLVVRVGKVLKIRGSQRRFRRKILIPKRGEKGGIW